MKRLIFSLAIGTAFLTTSCKTISTDASAVLGGANLPTVPGIPSLGQSEPVELKVGMCKTDVLSALGKPSYQYSILEKETWVYEDCNFIMDKAKETALNLVPGVGPTACLVMGLRAKTEAAKAAVTFDCKGIVTSFAQVECPEK